MQDLEVGIIVYSVVSCCFSLSVIVTILFFPSMTKGNLMPIILYISISDFFMNVASSFGFPNGGSVLCWAQGLGENYFALCSWFWTTMLAYRVYCTVRYGKSFITSRQMNYIGWGLPIILTLLPLSTTNYGASETDSQWCLFVQRRHTAQWWLPFWSYVTFFAWLFLCILCMLSWQALVTLRFRASPVRAAISRTYDKVYLYPVAMIVCWTLNYWCDDLSPSSGRSLNAVSMIFGISNGILTALIFMIKSEEAQRRWWLYFFPQTRSAFEEAVEPTIRVDFEEDELTSDDVPLSRRQRDSVATTTARTASVVGTTSDISMSDLTISTAGSSPFHV